MNNEVVFMTHKTTPTALKILAGANYAATESNRWIKLVELAECKVKPQDIIREWLPSGCLVYDPAGIITPSLANVPTQIPVALINVPATAIPAAPPGGTVPLRLVSHDQAATGRLAAAELLRSQRVIYAYVGWPTQAEWSRERGASFMSEITARGMQVLATSLRHTGNPAADEDFLARQLKVLPKPCGLFAANDETAVAVIQAATKAGISIPEELAVLGVDNITERCENTPVTLSSIEPDFFNAGVAAIQTLANGQAETLYGDLCVIHRASTRPEPGLPKELLNLVEFIRLHAAEGISAGDTIGKSGKRRQTEKSFRKFIGHSIGEEIQMVRVELAKQYLRNPSLSITEIGPLVGYASKNQLGRVFRAATGITMREWRRRKSATAILCDKQ